MWTRFVRGLKYRLLFLCRQLKLSFCIVDMSLSVKESESLVSICVGLALKAFSIGSRLHTV